MTIVPMARKPIEAPLLAALGLVHQPGVKALGEPAQKATRAVAVGVAPPHLDRLACFVQDVEVETVATEFQSACNMQAGLMWLLSVDNPRAAAEEASLSAFSCPAVPVSNLNVRRRRRADGRADCSADGRYENLHQKRPPTTSRHSLDRRRLWGRVQAREGSGTLRCRALTVLRHDPGRLSYVVVTAAHNEADNLVRLAESLDQQTLRPARWMIVENGSSDDTLEVMLGIGARLKWVRALSVNTTEAAERGAPIVRALHAGIEALDVTPDVLVNVDADVSMEPDFFDRLVAAFESEPSLGIASGTALELEQGMWLPRYVTGGNVRGATRAFRWACLQDVLPFEPRVGWDGIDQLRARARGWQTRMLLDLRFRHHRRVGERDASGWRAWKALGETAHYSGYRPSYLMIRALRHARNDLGALGLLVGYVQSVVGRRPQLEDFGARAILREDQRLRHLPARFRESRGRWAN